MFPKISFVSTCFLIYLSTFGAIADEQKLAKLELGVSAVSLYIPDYRGSSHFRSLFLPAPYVRYRSDTLKIDNGVQGVFLDSDRWLLTISGGATLPVGDENPERQGMERLKATLEIGPSLDYKIFQDNRNEIGLELPVRFAFTLEKSPRNLGPTFEPRLVWLHPAHKKYDWKLRFASGPLYASNKKHDYFYSVSSDNATANRPLYNATGGFSGIRSDFTYGKRFGNYRFAGFIRYDSLKSSVVEDSPLVTETSTWLVGVVFSWIFKEDY
ncbi:MAG: outer membrane protein [Gammaproteobacteria bacterium]|jgi:outer membrane scaffolding protein for murein synthesis (MipA/OmpV family)